jgi:hypothetical protein
MTLDLIILWLIVFLIWRWVKWHRDPVAIAKMERGFCTYCRSWLKKGAVACRKCGRIQPWAQTQDQGASRATRQ